LKNSRFFISFSLIVIYLVFLLISYKVDFIAGKQIGENSFAFLSSIIKIFPGIFILIGLFEVWVKRETIEKHFGLESGMRGYFFAILLASTTIGGLFVAFPVAYSLYHKGAKLAVIFTYIGAAAVCRVPMTIFEASFMGIKFSLIRLLVSLPLIIITSQLLASYLAKENYIIAKGK